MDQVVLAIDVVVQADRADQADQEIVVPVHTAGSSAYLAENPMVVLLVAFLDSAEDRMS